MFFETEIEGEIIRERGMGGRIEDRVKAVLPHAQIVFVRSHYTLLELDSDDPL